MNNEYHNEAAAHFTAAINTSVLSPELASHSKYEVFVVVCNVDIIHSECFSYSIVCFMQLFGWDLKSAWKTANQNRCHALLRAGRLAEAHEAYKYMIDRSDEVMKASCLDFSAGKSPVMLSDFNHDLYSTQILRENAVCATPRAGLLTWL